jgi:hypothetical protein
VSNEHEPCPKREGGGSHFWIGNSDRVKTHGEFLFCKHCDVSYVSDNKPLTPEQEAQAQRIIEAIVKGAQTLGPDEQIKVDTTTGETTFTKIPGKAS